MPLVEDNVAPTAEKSISDPDVELSAGSIGSSTDAQEGVTKVEALAQAWGKSGLVIAYFG